MRGDVYKMKLLKDKNKGLDDVFYMIPIKSTPTGQYMWQVRLKHNHYTVIATTSKEHALECLAKMVKKYKNFKTLTKASNDTLYYPVSTATLSRAINELKDSLEYASEVEDTVKKALDSITVDPFKKKPVVRPNKPKKTLPSKKEVNTPKAPKQKVKPNKPKTPSIKVKPLATKKKPLLRK